MRQILLETARHKGPRSILPSEKPISPAGTIDPAIRGYIIHITTKPQRRCPQERTR